MNCCAHIERKFYEGNLMAAHAGPFFYIMRGYAHKYGRK